MRFVCYLTPILIGIFTNSYCCDCDSIPIIQKELEISHTVFAGKVITIKPVYPKNKHYASTKFSVKFESYQMFKGKEHQFITLDTSASSCGYSFQINKSYLIYASDYQGVLNVSLCSRTKQIKNASSDIEELKALLKKK